MFKQYFFTKSLILPPETMISIKKSGFNMSKASLAASSISFLENVVTILDETLSYYISV